MSLKGPCAEGLVPRMALLASSGAFKKKPIGRHLGNCPWRGFGDPRFLLVLLHPACEGHGFALHALLPGYAVAFMLNRVNIGWSPWDCESKQTFWVDSDILLFWWKLTQVFSLGLVLCMNANNKKFQRLPMA